MSENAPNKTPITDLLSDVPDDARQMYEHSTTSHQNIPFGRLAKEALDEIKTLQAEVDELRAFKEQVEGHDPVVWPDKMVNYPAEDGGRIVGFHLPEGDLRLGDYGMSEPVAWLQSVTIDRCTPVAPNGYKLVPVSPTDEMLWEGIRYHACMGEPSFDDARQAYKAMLSAAPEGE